MVPQSQHIQLRPSRYRVRLGLSALLRPDIKRIMAQFWVIEEFHCTAFWGSVCTGTYRMWVWVCNTGYLYPAVITSTQSSPLRPPIDFVATMPLSVRAEPPVTATAPTAVTCRGLPLTHSPLPLPLSLPLSHLPQIQGLSDSASLPLTHSSLSLSPSPSHTHMSMLLSRRCNLTHARP